MHHIRSRAFSVMPLDVHQFLIGTMHLNATLTGAYILLSSYYWWNGALPNNDKFLASVARLDADTWRMQEPLIREFFELGDDGRLHLPTIDGLRAKQQKRSEKARASVGVRWKKWRERKLSENAHTNVQKRITSAPNAAEIKKGKASSLVLLSLKAKNKNIPPCSPPQGGSQNTPPEHQARSPRSHPHRRPSAGAAIRAGRELRRIGKSAEKAKTAEKARLAAFTAGNKGNPQPSRENGVAGPAGAIVKHSRGECQSQKAGAGQDARYVGFKDELFEYWKKLNPEFPELPWKPVTDRALNELLKACPEMAPSDLRRMLINRAHSTVAESEPVHKWLRDVYRYSSGPLDEFNKPRRPARQY